jgi:lysozyme
MRMSERGLALLKELEGCELEPYIDSAGLWTVGVGHCLTQSELASGKITCGDNTLRWKDGPLSEEDANLLLQDDVGWAEACVEVAVRVPLTQEQFESLVMFCFNIGESAFRNSTLCKLLNNQEYNEVPNQLRRWNKAGGRFVQGLANRREREITHWLEG